MGSEVVWWEGLVVPTLSPATPPTSPLLLYPNSYPLCQLILPPQDPLMGWVSLICGWFGTVDVEVDAKTDTALPPFCDQTISISVRGAFLAYDIQTNVLYYNARLAQWLCGQVLIM